MHQVRMDLDRVRHDVQRQSALCASLDQPAVHSKLMKFHSPLTQILLKKVFVVNLYLIMFLRITK